MTSKFKRSDARNLWLIWTCRCLWTRFRDWTQKIERRTGLAKLVGNKGKWKQSSGTWDQNWIRYWITQSFHLAYTNSGMTKTDKDRKTTMIRPTLEMQVLVLVSQDQDSQPLKQLVSRPNLLKMNSSALKPWSRRQEDCCLYFTNGKKFIVVYENTNLDLLTFSRTTWNCNAWTTVNTQHSNEVPT